MTQNKMTDDEEVIIETKPQTTKAKNTKFNAKDFFSFKNLPVLVSVLALFFALIAVFIVICGGYKGYLAMVGISTILNIGSLGLYTTKCIIDKRVSVNYIDIIIAFSILVNIIAIV